jgi:DNA-binding NarL/FixJ family response regulator
MEPKCLQRKWTGASDFGFAPGDPAFTAICNYVFGVPPENAAGLNWKARRRMRAANSASPKERKQVRESADGAADVYHCAVPSVSQIAVAEEYSSPGDAFGVVRAAASLPNRRPPRDANEGFSRAALDGAQASAPASVLAGVWEDLVRGRLRAWCDSITRDRIYLVAHLNRSHRGLSPDDSAVLTRVLCGEPQKVVAAELGIAISTASGRCQRALDQLDLAHRTMPLPLVLAAQSWAGVVHVPSACSAVFEQRGQLALIVSVPRPVTANMTALTRAEQEVAHRLIEGNCKKKIALQRATSTHTVIRQLSSIFGTLRVSGRCGLIRYAVGVRCFS